MTQAALTVVPEGVIEIVSPDSEYKDLQVGPPLYLSQGVKDVVVFDPRTASVLHYRPEEVVRHASPLEVTLTSGCRFRI